MKSETVASRVEQIVSELVGELPGTPQRGESAVEIGGLLGSWIRRLKGIESTVEQTTSRLDDLVSLGLGADDQGGS